jgi:hypothetical protein
MTKQYLAQKIIDEFDILILGNPVYTDFHNKLAEVLNTEFEADMQIQGTYVGTVPGPAPDPLNGTYYFSYNNYILTGAAMAAATIDFPTWVNYIDTTYKTVVINSSDDTSTINLSGSGTHIAWDFTLTQQDFIDIWTGLTPQEQRDLTRVDFLEKLCEVLLNDMSGVGLTPAAIPCTSIGGGTGTITFSVTSYKT